jgi:hypothetical protein
MLSLFSDKIANPKTIRKQHELKVVRQSLAFSSGCE